MASKGTSGVSRVLGKCQACIDAGNFYEAHQMYRTVYYRYVVQKKYFDAIDLIYAGSLTLLRHNQPQSGADLALLLIEVLVKASIPVSMDSIGKIIALFKLMSDEGPERHQYLLASINWSKKVEVDHKQGHPDLHQWLGLVYWQEKNYAQARYHLLHSTDGQSCADMLIEYHTMRGYPSEADLFITQAVLQYLTLHNKDTATIVFFAYTKQHPAVEKGPPFARPMLNFVWLLLLSIDGGKIAVFTVLCENYETCISRDPMYKEYLDKIGQIYFGVPPPRSTSQGFLGDLMSTLMGGGGDDEGVMSPGISNTPAMTPVELD